MNRVFEAQMKRLILISALALMLAPNVSASPAAPAARWCGSFSLQRGTATYDYKLQVRNLTCAKGRTTATLALSTASNPNGFQCASSQQELSCWTRKHYRWFNAFLTHVNTPGAPAPPQPAQPSSPSPSPSPTKGSRSNPFPIGDAAGDSEWALKVNSVNPDAWPFIAAANQFNDPPPTGWVDVLVNLTGKYLGAGQGDVTFSFLQSLAVAGDDGLLIHAWDHDCGVPPDPNNLDYSTVSTSTAFRINECWQVPASEVPSLELYYDNSDTNRHGWFALH